MQVEDKVVRVRNVKVGPFLFKCYFICNIYGIFSYLVIFLLMVPESTVFIKELHQKWQLLTLL